MHRRLPPSHAAAASVGAYPQTLMLDLGFEDPHRFIGRRRERFARTQAETRPMTRANDLGALDFPTRQCRAVVSADILYGKKCLAAAHHGNHTLPDDDRLCMSVLQIRSEACIDPGRHHRLARIYI